MNCLFSSLQESGGVAVSSLWIFSDSFIIGIHWRSLTRKHHGNSGTIFDFAWPVHMFHKVLELFHRFQRFLQRQHHGGTSPKRHDQIAWVLHLKKRLKPIWKSKSLKFGRVWYLTLTPTSQFYYLKSLDLKSAQCRHQPGISNNNL